jgi:hypothetical protein
VGHPVGGALNSRSRVYENTFVISETGRVSGVAKVTVSGLEAHFLDKSMSKLTAKDIEERSENTLAGSKYNGTLALERGVLDKEKALYTYSSTYDIEDFVTPGTPGALSILPIFASSIIARHIGNPSNELPARDFLCSNGRWEENYEFTLPASITVLALPKDIEVLTPVQSYIATYKQEGQVIRVKRVLNDTSPMPVCPVEAAVYYNTVARKAIPDLKAQIIYK